MKLKKGLDRLPGERVSEAAMRHASVQIYKEKLSDAIRRRNRVAAAHARHAREEKHFKHQLEEADAEVRALITKSGQQSARVRGFNYTPSYRVIAEIYDRDEYLAYASLPENRDLLHKRIAMEAATERWGTDIDHVKIDIPGVRPGKVPTLSVTKAKATKR